MATSKIPEIVKTLTITNFAGRLTRQDFGDLNSGFAKYTTSWGYDPFTSPGSLSWVKSPIDVTGIITDSSLVLAAQSRIESGTLYTYAISDSGKLWKIGGDGSSATNIATLSTGTPTWAYGASLQFFNGFIWISNDKGLTRINFDGSSETQVGTWDSSHFIQNTYHPLLPFGGNLVIGNTTDGTVTNIGIVDSSNTILNYTKLSPALPTGSYVRDLDVTPDLTYLLISLSYINQEAIAPVNDGGNAGSSDSLIVRWNGADLGATAGVGLPSFGITALNSFGAVQYAFMYDLLGASLYQNTNKVLTLRNQKSPLPNATISTGNFVTWMAPGYEQNLDTSAGAINGYLYYYGALDNEVGPGLWRILKVPSAIGGSIYQVPFNHFTTNRYVSVNTSDTITTVGSGTHIFSYTDYTGAAGQTAKKLKVFLIAPPDSWSGPVAGVYETQTQIFSKRQQIKQIRVYCAATKANNGFNLDLIGSNGKKITNGNFSYTFDNATGAVERINFNPAVLNVFSMGLRITNTGSENMTIPKIEVDICESGK